MSPPIVFLDTECTGLALDDDIWEFAAIRREPSGSETSSHFFIEHDRAKCDRLPEPFGSDHRERFPTGGDAFAPDMAAQIIAAVTAGAHIVGAVPNFDTERLAILMGRHERVPKWHYHLIDVENLAVGWLWGIAEGYRSAAGAAIVEVPKRPRLPWDSDELSRAVGVDPEAFARHTAMGDVLWARALYDKVMGR